MAKNEGEPRCSMRHCERYVRDHFWAEKLFWKTLQYVMGKRRIYVPKGHCKESAHDKKGIDGD